MLIFIIKRNILFSCSLNLRVYINKLERGSSITIGNIITATYCNLHCVTWWLHSQAFVIMHSWISYSNKTIEERFILFRETFLTQMINYVLTCNTMQNRSEDNNADKWQPKPLRLSSIVELLIFASNHKQ